MAKLHSGMDAWRYIVRSENKRLPVEGYLPLILSAAAALGVLPFAIRRFMNGEWLAGIIDVVLIVGFLALGTYVFTKKKVRLASITLSVMAVGGVLATVYLSGPQQVYWAFPALVGVFYLVRLREAIACALVTVFALIPPMLAADDPLETTTALITIVITCVLAVAFAMITNRQRSQLLKLATKDPLTGAGNRRALDSKLRHVVNAFQRTGAPASLLMLDLDHFKTVNDLLGHAAGDEILKNVTEIINLRIRVTDSLYRIGGEEFVIVLEGADVEHAAHLAEQLRTLVDANELVPEHTVTISLGVAELRKSESPYDWLHRADSAMYRAKDAGRNATSVSS
jgi:diguanylate cyclase (GGDEF)-like protein